MHRPIPRLIVFVLMLNVSLCQVTIGQSLEVYKSDIEKIYGKDANLINGEKYYYPYYNCEGDPYLDPLGHLTSICIKEKDYENQVARYDIYNQHLVLEYEDLYGGNSNLVIRNEWLESFSYKDKYFKRITGPEGRTVIYQIIYADSISCYYYWAKELNLTQSSGSMNYYFTSPIREAYVVINNRFYKYRSNRSYIRIFPEDKRKLIRDYIRQNDISTKKSSESEIRKLTEYCNSVFYGSR